MATETTVFRILKMLIAAYPREPIQDETPQLYKRFLSDLPDEILEAAVMQHISSSPFFPRVSELREAAANLAVGIEDLPPAMQAWGLVLKYMNGFEEDSHLVHYGRDQVPEFENPILMQTINAMGWRQLCDSTNQISDRARFIETYNAHFQRAKREAVTLPEVRHLAVRLRSPGIPAGQLPSRIDANQDIEEETNKF
jgi:hypothetical protein